MTRKTGYLQDNRIVYNDTASEFSTAVNVGPETLPNTYTFARNQWLNLANPTAAGSTPSLPVPETDGTYGVGPAATTDGPHIWDFAWGKWIVNANATQQTVDVTAFQSMRQAIAGPDASFDPLDADPLGGVWTSTDIPTSTLLLPAFSQAILIDPAACPSCLPITGDYDANGQVDLQDYDVWKSNFGTANVASDGNHDGIVDAADYVVWRNNFGSGTLLPNDDTAGMGADDYNRWKTHFGELGGSGSGEIVAAPEPPTALLDNSGGCGCVDTTALAPLASLKTR